MCVIDVDLLYFSNLDGPGLGRQKLRLTHGPYLHAQVGEVSEVSEVPRS